MSRGRAWNDARPPTTEEAPMATVDDRTGTRESVPFRIRTADGDE